MSPDAVVVRGGTGVTVERVAEVLGEAIADGDGPVLSVFADVPAAGETESDVIYRLCKDAGLPHRQVQVTSASRLLETDVNLVLAVDAGEAANHHHVVFSQPLDQSQIAKFVDAWDAAVPNPTGGKRRS